MVFDMCTAYEIYPVSMSKGFSYDPHMGTEEKKVKFNEKIKKLKEVSAKLGCTLSQLAIAWDIKNRDVTVCLLGASKVNYMKC